MNSLFVCSEVSCKFHNIPTTQIYSKNSCVRKLGLIRPKLSKLFAKHYNYLLYYNAALWSAVVEYFMFNTTVTACS
jgi:hypothetical protein